MKYFEFQELFICECHDTSHQFIISADPLTVEFPEVYVSIHLNRDHNIFRRMWTAMKYIFGMRSTLGDFDEVIIKPEDADRLQGVVDYLRKAKESRNKTIKQRLKQYNQINNRKFTEVSITSLKLRYRDYVQRIQGIDYRSDHR